MKIKIITMIIIIIFCLYGTIEASGLASNSKAAIVFDKTYNKVLYGKEINKRLPNASTTKILTAIVAYENGNLNDTVIVSLDAANTPGSSLKLRKGDKVSLNDLIKGMLLCSGNDAAVAIAEHIGGSVPKFCDLMNQKAKEIGAVNTNFVTPHGLDNENHYSTAYDLAIISEYALDNKYLADIVDKREITIKINNYSRNVGTTNEMLSFYEGANGIKTGYTGDAGRCLVTSATKNDRQLISVVLGCGTRNQRTSDSVKLLDYGFNNFIISDLCKNMKKDFHIRVNKSKEQDYIIKFDVEYFMPILKGQENEVRFKYKLDSLLEAPIKENDRLGEIIIYLGEEELNRIVLTCNQGIKRKNMSDYIKELTSSFLKNIKIDF